MFEWDDKKNKANQKKHGVRFETATIAFQDRFLLTEYDDRYHYDEARWQSIGSIKETLVHIGHIVEDFYEEEIIRIISAREAGSGEARRYRIHRGNAERIASVEKSQGRLH